MTRLTDVELHNFINRWAAAFCIPSLHNLSSYMGSAFVPAFELFSVCFTLASTCDGSADVELHDLYQ